MILHLNVLFATHGGMEYKHALQTRRSVKAGDLIEPGPDQETIEQIITIAARVPDHGKLAPWRFKVMDKRAQAVFGDVLAVRFAEKHPEASDRLIEKERLRPQRAPLLIVLVFQPVLGKIPVWEQQLSTGAAGMNLLHAAHAYGYAGQWLTEWPAYDPVIAKHLGCGSDDAVVGFFYIGSASEVPSDRKRPNVRDILK